MRALIVEQGWSRGALGAARALAAAGWHVGVGAPTRRGLAVSSRACRRRHVVPAAHLDAGLFLEAVDAAVRQGGYDVVFGAGEAEVLALSAGRSRLTAVVPHAAHDDVVRALDKGVLAEAARSVGIAVPTALDPATLPADDRLYVVKAKVHARPDTPGAPPRIDTLAVRGSAAARRRADAVRAAGAVPEVQEFHEGPLLAYSCVLSRDGDVVADVQQVAAAIWPPQAGASARGRTVPVDTVLAEWAAALLRDLGWFGLAELQFVVPADGSPRLIDLNGRFYGSISLAVAAGANLPATWAALATGRPAVTVRARPGVRYQWLEGDLRRAFAERRGGLARDLASTLRGTPGAAHSTMSARDPGPVVARLVALGGETLPVLPGRAGRSGATVTPAPAPRRPRRRHPSHSRGSAR